MSAVVLRMSVWRQCQHLLRHSSACAQRAGPVVVVWLRTDRVGIGDKSVPAKENLCCGVGERELEP